MSQHERDGAVESHLVVQIILKHVQIVQSVRIITTTQHMYIIRDIARCVTTTHLVVLRARESACSGIPYTCSTPGNEMSIPTELGPSENNTMYEKNWWIPSNHNNSLKIFFVESCTCNKNFSCIKFSRMNNKL